MDIAIVILLVAAAICFLLAFLNAVQRYSIIGLGLLCWVVTELINAVQKLT